MSFLLGIHYGFFRDEGDEQSGHCLRCERETPHIEVETGFKFTVFFVLTVFRNVTKKRFVCRVCDNELAEGQSPLAPDHQIQSQNKANLMANWALAYVLSAKQDEINESRPGDRLDSTLDLDYAKIAALRRDASEDPEAIIDRLAAEFHDIEHARRLDIAGCAILAAQDIAHEDSEALRRAARVAVALGVTQDELRSMIAERTRSEED